MKGEDLKYDSFFALSIRSMNDALSMSKRWQNIRVSKGCKVSFLTASAICFGVTIKSYTASLNTKSSPLRSYTLPRAGYWVTKRKALLSACSLYSWSTTWRANNFTIKTTPMAMKTPIISNFLVDRLLFFVLIGLIGKDKGKRFSPYRRWLLGVFFKKNSFRQKTAWNTDSLDFFSYICTVLYA